VKLSLQAAGASASIDGTLRDPLDGTGYVLDVNATVPALETLQPFSPGPRLPPLHDLSLAAHVADGVPLLQRVTQLKLHIGASDLGTVAPGLQLAALDASAPALDQAVQITGAGSIAGKPLKLDAHLGAPSLALVHQPVTLDITAQAGGATGSVKGSLTRATTLPDIDAVVALRVPDMTELASLTHRRLPALTSVAFDGHVSGTTKQLALSGFKLTTAQGDLADDLTLGLGDTRSLRGSVTATRIDVDALRAALALPPLPDAAPAGPPPVPPLPVHKRGDHWLIPDTPLPLDSLRATDADLTAKIGTLHEAGVDVRDLGFHLVLSDGRLVLDPFAAQLPGGRMSGSLSLDASQPDPPVALHVHAPGIAMQTLLAALGVPPAVSGAMDIDADLKGAGRTPHAMAAVADGTIGLSMQGGRVDNALLGGAFADLLRAANIGQKISGSSELRCFAFRAALSHGRATVQTLLVDSPELHIEGGGTINLADESLALDLRPLAKIGGNGIAIPVHVAGSLRDPKAQIDAGAVAGAIDHGGGFRAIIGALSQEATTEACAPALAVARGQAPPERAPAAPATAGGKLPKPADLLRQLVR
jgi:AsmA protein